VKPKRIALLVAVAIALSLAAGGCPKLTRAGAGAKATTEDARGRAGDSRQDKSEDETPAREPAQGEAG
jgi:hypothetical protein